MNDNVPKGGQMKKRPLPTKEEYLNSVRKFTDKELVEAHRLGHSDRYIAKIFNCSKSTVRGRRCKLGLKANYDPPFGGKKKEPEELTNERRKWLRNNTNRQIKKYREDDDYRNHVRKRTQLDENVRRKESKEMGEPYYDKLRKRKQKSWNQYKEKFPEKVKKKNRRWYLENKDLILAQSKKRYYASRLKEAISQIGSMGRLKPLTGVKRGT